MKVPDWKYAPEWANYAAMDTNGRWFWFELRPTPVTRPAKGEWRGDSRDGRIDSVVNFGDFSDINFTWENSLIERPTEDIDRINNLKPSGQPCSNCGRSREELFKVGIGYSEGFGITTCNACASVSKQSTPFDVEGYDSLADVLTRAYDQAARGKGKERHANDLPFAAQPMQAISDLLHSEKGMAFQACKKIQEGLNLPHEAKIKELLGAIVYISGAIIWLERNSTICGDSNHGHVDNV